ncbi:MAG: carbohydrate ABC transporter permease [Lachnospiraceae bacterium]|nr:carbohydrate ABC transporter permease [Lachnospiraceae bacterium]
MAKGNRKKLKVSQVLILIFLIVLVVVYLAPLLWIIIVSLKTNSELTLDPFGIPKELHWENFKEAWEKAYLGVALRNSVIVCSATLVVSLLFGSMAAFAIGRMRWKFSGAMMTYFLVGMMIPVHCVLIPLYVQFSKIKMTDSLISIIIPYITFSLPITIYIMVGFFRSMPGELFEAACIDGCNIYRCFFTIALPLSKTGLFVTGLMTFVGNWNELLLALVFISDKMKKTLPVTLSYFAGPYKTNYVQMFAAILIAIAPNVIVYCIFSNQIVEGLTVGAVKG